MKAFTKFATAAVAAGGLMAAASPASALTQFANFNTPGVEKNIQWDGNTAGGGTLSTNGAVDVKFNFTDALLISLGLTNLDAAFTLDATIPDGNPAQVTDLELPLQDLVTQMPLSGSFSFIYTGAASFNVNGHVINTGANLLSGTFANAWLQMQGSSGSASAATIGGAVIAPNSSVLNFDNSEGFDFTFALTGAAPAPIGTQAGGSISDFTATVGGQFEGVAVPVPEPGSWALMIMGFGGAGAMLRSRRRAAACA